MAEIDRARYIARAPTVELDKATLTALASMVAEKDRTVLLGFNDYCKHLINMFPGQIVAAVDDLYDGIVFRGVPVFSTQNELPDHDQMLLCDYGNALVYKRRYYKEAVEARRPFRFCDKYGPETTKIVDYIRLDPLYQCIWAQRHMAPSSMMSEAGLFFILELLRSCLKVPGEVAEVGAWQGGSAWYMAQLLHQTDSAKCLYVFEMGEELKQDNPQGIVSEQQMVRDLSFYPKTQCFFGPATPHLKRLEGKRYSFVFMDFGFTETILSMVYEQLSPGGVLLLDNYGHMLGHPDQFDAFLARHEATAIRMHKSPVAFVIKREQNRAN